MIYDSIIIGKGPARDIFWNIPKKVKLECSYNWKRWGSFRKNKQNR